MGFFNDKQVEAFETGRYICSECGAVMEFEDKWEDVLICPECGHSIDSDRYGCEVMKNMRPYTQRRKKCWATMRTKMSPMKSTTKNSTS